MRTVIFPLTNIRPPLTGIGNYAVDLITNLTANILDQQEPAAIALNAAIGGTFVYPKDLKRYLTQLRESDPTTHSRWRALRGLAANMPGARWAYSNTQRRLLTQLVDTLPKQDTLVHDLNYISNPASQWAARTRLIYTVYDLSHYRYPDTHPSHRVRFLDQFFSNLARSDHPIITISEFSKRELSTIYSIAQERILVTPLAADTTFFPRANAQSVLTEYGLKQGQYCLILGTKEPRKNLSTAVRAYSQLPRVLQEKLPLVIVGAKGWKHAKTDKLLRRMHATGTVVLLPYIARAHLPYLYSGARMMLFPSLYEGFGLPILESMACGCPVITADRGAMYEVAGDAAITLDPLDTQALSEAIQLLSSESEYEFHRQQGLLRSQAFSWDVCAQRTMSLYKQTFTSI